MNIEDLNIKPNSHKYKAEQKAEVEEKRNIEKVVSGSVKTKKKSGVTKLADVFIAEDVTSVKDYLVSDVLVPALKKLITDIVKNGVDMLAYGATSSSKQSPGRSNVSYRKYYDDRRDDRGPVRDARARARFDFDEIVFNTRGDAEAVREQMEDVIDHYGFVTVADMYEMVELDQPYTSNKYGWTSIRNAEVIRVRDGFIIKLPKAMPIE